MSHLQLLSRAETDQNWVSCIQFRALVHRLEWFAEKFLKYGYWSVQWDSESLYQDVLHTGNAKSVNRWSRNYEKYHALLTTLAESSCILGTRVF